MLAKRIITCLDVKEGRTVKGLNFKGLEDAGDMVELAARYSEQGADELVFLDITASRDKRQTMQVWVKRVAEVLRIPFTVGGGIASGKDVGLLLRSGADKVAVNSAALADPSLITRLAERFGEQCIVVAVDAREERGEWKVYSHGGRKKTERELFSWVKEAEERGAGEILFTSIDKDGTRKGFACEALARISEEVGIPVIASGGAGCPADFYDVFVRGKADAALAAGIFHYGETNIREVKTYLREKGIEVRI